MSKITLKDIVEANARDLISVSASDSLQNAARTISAHQVGILMVADDRGGLAGILSERDVTRAFADHGADAINATVSDYMSTDVVMCEESEDPYTAIWLMHEYGIRHLPIAVNGTPKVILSSRDVLKYLSDHASPEEQATLWEKRPPTFGY